MYKLELKTYRTVLLTVLSAIAGITAVNAGETATEVSAEKNPVPIEPSETSDWNFTFRPYLWAASLLVPEWDNLDRGWGVGSK